MPRFGADQQVIAADGSGRRTARLLNISTWGIALEMTAPAACGAPMRIELQEVVACGEVAYCHPVAGSYFVGVKLDCALEAIAGLVCVPEEPAAPASVRQAGHAANY